MSGFDAGILFMAKWARPRRGRRTRARIAAALLAMLLLQGVPAEAGALERAMLGKAAIVDLTHTVSDPGSWSEPAHPETLGEAGQSGVDLTTGLSTRLHAGGPVGQETRSVAQIPSRELLVPAVVVNVAQKVAESAEYQATVEDLRAWERQNGRIPRKSAVLLQTGWSRRWADPARYVNQDVRGMPRVPGFSPAALAFLATERQVRGVGLDALVPDAPASVGGHAVSRGMPPGVWQLENLVNLERLPAKGAKLVVAPLRIEAAAALVRVIAILP